MTSPPAAPVPRRASAPFLRGHLAHFIAMGFGSGLSPRAPGTAGTLWAWLAFLAISFVWAPSDAQWAVIIGIAFAIGWWACTVTARHLGTSDPSAIVIDEIAAFWLVLLLVMPAGFWAQLAAFLLFRFFDAAKPGPVGWADRLFKGFGARGGFGIMFDDLVAAFCTLLVIALWRFW
ncbi:MAG: hypothetical protein RIQ96_100 [Pseudomonadota bacterium]|jgi:phosphatidylglycerophosphatase A